MDSDSGGNPRAAGRLEMIQAATKMAPARMMLARTIGSSIVLLLLLHDQLHRPGDGAVGRGVVFIRHRLRRAGAERIFGAEAVGEGLEVAGAQVAEVED